MPECTKNCWLFQQSEVEKQRKRSLQEETLLPQWRPTSQPVGELYRWVKKQECREYSVYSISPDISSLEHNFSSINSILLILSQKVPMDTGCAMTLILYTVEVKVITDLCLKSISRMSIAKKINEPAAKNKRTCNFQLSNCCFEYKHACFILVEYMYSLLLGFFFRVQHHIIQDKTSLRCLKFVYKIKKHLKNNMCTRILGD